MTHSDIEDGLAPSARLPWVKPHIEEADIAGITESVGLGNNDGAASHS